MERQLTGIEGMMWGVFHRHGILGFVSLGDRKGQPSVSRNQCTGSHAAEKEQDVTEGRYTLSASRTLSLQTSTCVWNKDRYLA